MVDIKKRGYGFLPEIGLQLSVVEQEWIPFLKLLQNGTKCQGYHEHKSNI